MSSRYNRFDDINRRMETYPWEDRHTPGRKQEYNPFTDPHFDARKLETNEITVRNQTFAKIPGIPDRIFTKDTAPAGIPLPQGLTGDEILFLAGFKTDGTTNEATDKATDETTDKTTDGTTDKIPDQITAEKQPEVVIIGHDMAGLLDGMMLITDEYHNYFDREGLLWYDPMRKLHTGKPQRKEKETKEETETKIKEQTKEKTEEKKDTDPTPNSREENRLALSPEDRTVDEIKASLLEKEKLLEEKLKEAENEKEQYRQKNRELDEYLRKAEEANELLEAADHARKKELSQQQNDHLRFLDNILDSFQTTVREMAKKKPGLLMSQRQIQTINEILQELQSIFTGTTAEDYLHLAEEPREEDLEHFPGTTYGEMALLLSAYNYALHDSALGRIYMK